MSPHVPMTAQEWFTVAELAELALPGLPTTKRGIQMIADREGWATYRDSTGAACFRPRKARGGGLEYHVSLLPEAARTKLSKVRPAKAERVDRESALLRYDRLPQTVKDEALRRLTIIQRVETLQRDGLTKNKAIEYAAQEIVRAARASGEKPAASERTIHAWFERVRGVAACDRVAYLAPSYAGRAATSAIPEEAWELYKANYLRLEKPTHARCYRDLEAIAAKREWTLPSQKTFERRIEAEVAENVRIHLREGPKAARHAFPYADRDKSMMHPHQVANLDGHIWDVFCLFENGVIGRPVSVAVQDIFSGFPLAVRFDTTLNHHGVRLALGDTFRDYGLVERLIMDNGTENQARQISGGHARFRCKAKVEEADGLLKILGIKPVFAKPYWGQAKPIERMFGDWARDIAKHPAFAGAYVGHKTDAKPENYRSKAVPIAEFERIVRLELERYRQQLGRRGAGMNGRSFADVYWEGVKAAPPQKLTTEQLRLCMLASEPRPMDRQSGFVSIMDHRYWSEALGALKRQRVIVRFDPADLSKPVYIYSLDGRFLAEAPRTMQGSYDNARDAQDISKAGRDYRRLTAAAAKLAKRLGIEDVAAELDGAPPAPARKATGNVVAPAFGVPRKPDTHSEFTSQADRVLLARFQGGS